MGLWHSDDSHFSRGGHNRFSGKFGIRYDVNSGITGPVYLLGKLSRFGYEVPEDVRAISNHAMVSLTGDTILEKNILPGVHF